MADSLADSFSSLLSTTVADNSHSLFTVIENAHLTLTEQTKLAAEKIVRTRKEILGEVYNDNVAIDIFETSSEEEDDREMAKVPKLTVQELEDDLPSYACLVDWKLVDSVKANLDDVTNELSSCGLPAAEAKEVTENISALRDLMTKLKYLEQFRRVVVYLTSVSGAERLSVANAKIISFGASLKKLLSKQDVASGQNLLKREVYAPLVSFLIDAITYMTGNVLDFWYQMFVMVESPNEPKALRILQPKFPRSIQIKDQLSEMDRFVSERLSEMAILEKLETSVERLSKFIVDNLYVPILTSPRPSNAIKYEVRMGVTSFSVNEAPLSRRWSTAKKPYKPDFSVQFLTDVLKAAETLLTNLNAALYRYSVNGVPFLRILGKHLASPLFGEIEKRVLLPMVPASLKDVHDNSQPTEVVRAFCDDLQAVGWPDDMFAKFRSFYENFADTVVMKRGADILIKTNNLISKPLTKTKEVGSASGALEFPSNTAVPRSSQFFNLPPMQVSLSTIKLGELLQSAVQDIREGYSLTQKETLLDNVVCAFEMFCAESEKIHENGFLNSAHDAAVFYCNCHYMRHVVTQLCETELPKLKVHTERYRKAFARFTQNLPQLASRCLVRHNVYRCTQLKTALGKEPFSDIADRKAFQKARDVLSGFVSNLLHTKRIWLEIFTKEAYLEAMSGQVSGAFAVISKEILNEELISQLEAKCIHGVFSCFVNTTEECFRVAGHPNLLDEWKQNSAYVKSEEIIFCLGSPLERIVNRWKGGEGPLLQRLSRAEVRRLLGALFHDVPDLADVLANFSTE